MDAPRKPLLVIISPHARERWVERIADPKRYEHLGACSGCRMCHSLLNDIRGVIRIGARQIDSAIGKRLREALDAGQRVVDANFLEAFKKQFGGHVPYEFYQSGKAVFVTVKNDKEGEPPVLVTVLTEEMIDGTAILRADTPEEMKTVFKRWQFEARQRRS